MPGGSPEASALHVARTITRRAERRIVALQEQDSINSNTLVFINRFVRLLLAAARYANVKNDQDDHSVPEW